MTRPTLIIGSLIFSIAALLAILPMLEPDQLRALTDLHPGWLAAGLGVYLLNYLFRTWRFTLLLDRHRVPTGRLLGVTQIHGALNYLLPARLGELAFPLLIKRVGQADYSLGTASLLAARALDLAALVLLLPVALLISAERLPTWMLAGGMLLSLCAIAAAAWVLSILSRGKERSSTPDEPASDTGIRTRAWAFARRTWRHLERGLSPRALPALVAASIGIWLCIALNFHLILAAMGVSTSFFTAFAITLAMLPLSLLPIQGIANIGTHEAAWIAVLVLFGLDPHQANAIAVVSHGVLLGYVIILGIIGLALISIRVPPKEARNET